MSSGSFTLYSSAVVQVNVSVGQNTAVYYVRYRPVLIGEGGG